MKPKEQSPQYVAFRVRNRSQWDEPRVPPCRGPDSTCNGLRTAKLS